MSPLYGSGDFVYVTHPETGGRALVPADTSVLEVLQVKGWQVEEETPPDLDPDAPNTGNTPARQEAEEHAAALKGAALTEALEAAGLPKSGTAEEKRQRLADWEAAQSTPTPDEDASAAADDTDQEEVTNG